MRSISLSHDGTLPDGHVFSSISSTESPTQEAQHLPSTERDSEEEESDYMFMSPVTLNPSKKIYCTPVSVIIAVQYYLYFSNLSFT